MNCHLYTDVKIHWKFKLCLCICLTLFYFQMFLLLKMFLGHTNDSLDAKKTVEHYVLCISPFCKSITSSTKRLTQGNIVLLKRSCKHAVLRKSSTHHCVLALKTLCWREGLSIKRSKAKQSVFGSSVCKIWIYLWLDWRSQGFWHTSRKGFLCWKKVYVGKLMAENNTLVENCFVSICLFETGIFNARLILNLNKILVKLK